MSASRPKRYLAVFALATLVVTAAVAGAAAWWLSQPLPLPGAPFAFDVKPGANLKSVARDLVGAGILPHELPLVALARLREVDRSIKAGNYEVSEGITLPRLLDKLTQGDVTQTSLTVVEGSTFAELAATLDVEPRGGEERARHFRNPSSRSVSAWRGRASRGGSFRTRISSPPAPPISTLMARAHRLMQRRLAAAWQRRAVDTPLKDPYAALILASIVEKETGRAADRPLIASVFVNRLRLGMRLQSDPTVIYGMGARFDGNLRKRDLDADTPYNTYTRDGLPPTPIALPGQASLDAAVDPPKTAFLYFVARGDGSSEFSANLTDHNRAVARFQLGRR